jgi:hypothetical protein
VVGDFKKIGVDVVLGGAAGAVDQFVQYWDDKRAADYAVANPGKSMSFWSQFGTYLNFLAPAALVGAEAMGWMPSSGDMATRLNTIAGSLAGRKATHRFAKTMSPTLPPAPYTQYRRIAARDQAAAAAARAAATRTLNEEFAGAGIV